MRKLLIVLSALMMIASLSACDTTSSDSSSNKAADNSSISESDSKSESSDSESNESSDEETKSDFEFKINSASFGSDYEGKDVLIIEYDFTNNSDKAASFTFACQDTVFQDGIECDSTVVGCDEVDVQEQLNDIQPGKTYTLKVGYHISDKSKPVDVVITDILGINKLLEESIDLSGQ